MVLEKTLEGPLNIQEIKLVTLTGNQPWIFIGRTDAEAEVQYVFHLMWRAVSLEKILMLRKIEGQRIRGNRRWDGWMASLTQWTWVWASYNSWWWTGRPGMLQPMGCKELHMTEWLHWAELEEQKETSAGNGKNWPALNKGCILGWLFWTQEERHDIDYIIDACACAVLYHPVLSDSLRPQRL